MKTMSARDAKHQFGRLIDTARAEPVVVEKHGRPEGYGRSARPIEIPFAIRINEIAAITGDSLRRDVAHGAAKDMVRHDFPLGWRFDRARITRAG